MKIYMLVLSMFLLILVSCNGPRNIYSASPFVSPVPMQKKATSVGVDYFTHVRERNVRDSVPGNHDNGFGFNFSHMLSERTLVFTQMDIKNERNQYHDSIPLANDLLFNEYDGGFDSSIVFGKRHSISAGIELFSANGSNSNFALALTMTFNQMKISESGLLHRVPYQRFYKMNQLSLSIQPGVSFNLSEHLSFSWIVRLTVLKNFDANTNYSDTEKVSAKLRDNSMNIFFGLTGFYLEYQPVKSLPLYFNGQFFNDLSYSPHPASRYTTGNVHMKGTGMSIGTRFIFN